VQKATWTATAWLNVISSQGDAPISGSAPGSRGLTTECPLIISLAPPVSVPVVEKPADVVSRVNHLFGRLEVKKPFHQTVDPGVEAISQLYLRGGFLALPVRRVGQGRLICSPVLPSRGVHEGGEVAGRFRG
jgi:hypothetical protein